MGVAFAVQGDGADDGPSKGGGNGGCAVDSDDDELSSAGDVASSTEYQTPTFCCAISLVGYEFAKIPLEPSTLHWIHGSSFNLARQMPASLKSTMTVLIS